MTPLALDTEITTWSKGNAFDRRNKAVCFSWADENSSGASPFTSDSNERLRGQISRAGILIGFNWKFDAHWFRRQGVDVSGKRVHDCQIAEFILTNQRERYPSLEGCCIKYGLGHKIDVIKTEYWDKGINTDEIPWPVLSEYAEMDAILTLRLYEAQRAIMTPEQVKLLRLMCLDLLILEEMEWNGLKYDKGICEQRSGEIATKIQHINTELSSVYPDVPINFNSGDQLSAFLYGGIVKEEVRIHDGFFKTGLRKGEPKFRKEEVAHVLPRLVTPIKGSELKKDGVWATNEATLRKLSGAKRSVALILELAKLEKLNGTYYEGLPNLCDEMNWEPEYIHGQFNQCVAQTGRLSSNRPNLQNLSGDVLNVIISRYSD